MATIVVNPAVRLRSTIRELQKLRRMYGENLDLHPEPQVAARYLAIARKFTRLMDEGGLRAAARVFALATDREAIVDEATEAAAAAHLLAELQAVGPDVWAAPHVEVAFERAVEALAVRRRYRLLRVVLRDFGWSPVHGPASDIMRRIIPRLRRDALEYHKDTGMQTFALLLESLGPYPEIVVDVLASGNVHVVRYMLASMGCGAGAGGVVRDSCRRALANMVAAAEAAAQQHAAPPAGQEVRARFVAVGAGRPLDPEAAPSQLGPP
jgi:hypothetical protein